MKVSKKEIEQFLHARIKQVKQASRRTRIPYSLISILSLLILAQSFVLHFGWNLTRQENIDDGIKKAILGLEPATKSPRVARYHESLSDSLFAGEIMSDSISRYFSIGIKMNHLKCYCSPRIERGCRIPGHVSSSDSTKICQRLEIELLALDALMKESELIENQRLSQHSIWLPIIGFNFSIGDMGVIGAMIYLLLMGFYFASARREYHSLREFIMVKRWPNFRKRPGYYLKFADLDFTPSQYYYGFEEICHSFLFISSTPDKKLEVFNRMIMALPMIVIGLLFVLDTYDNAEHYQDFFGLSELESEAYFHMRFLLQFVLVLIVAIVNFGIIGLQGKIKDTLRGYSYVTRSTYGEIIFRQVDESVIKNEGIFSISIPSDRSKSKLKKLDPTEASEIAFD